MDKTNSDPRLLGVIKVNKEAYKRIHILLIGLSILMIAAGVTQTLDDDAAYQQIYGRHMTLNELFTKKVCTINPPYNTPYKKIVRANEPCLNKTEIMVLQPMTYGSEYEQQEFNRPSWKKNGSPLISIPLTNGGNNMSDHQ